MTKNKFVVALAVITRHIPRGRERWYLRRAEVGAGARER